jgi:3'(2'), 5'-bisphosphate nucleotidase
MDYGNLLGNAGDIADKAGVAIMDIYRRDYETVEKDDERDSPLTEADTAAHEIICAQLQELTPEIPVLSEESDDFDNRLDRETLWIVDPLDGTREFINQNGEFTVNIALVEHGQPVLGVVHAPALDTTYSGLKDEGAFRDKNGESTPITAQSGDDNFKIVASRSHRDENSQAFLNRFPEAETTSIGSSLKLCLLAQGDATLYPRFAPTMEWDTAAGDAVVRAAGGGVYQLTGELLQYNKSDLYNPFFIATTSDAPPWRSKIPQTLAEK